MSFIVRGMNGLVGLNPPCARVIKFEGKFGGFTILAPYGCEFADSKTLDEAKERIAEIVKGKLPEVRLRMKEVKEIWGYKK